MKRPTKFDRAVVLVGLPVGIYLLIIARIHPGCLSRLELLGQVPEGDQNGNDWQLAQTTTWWGNPLNPKKFWKGRVLRNDGRLRKDAPGI